MKKNIFYTVLALMVVIVGVMLLSDKRDDTNISSLEVEDDVIKENIVVNDTTMNVTSSVFEYNQSIPKRYTCDGENINPPLEVTDVPEGAKSLAFIMDDPDAPVGTWVHWIMWNIDPTVTSIAENSVPAGAVEGTTSFGRPGHGGPCPPTGVHRYFFKLYALDTLLDIGAIAKKEDLLRAMEGHILANSELIGLYSRK